jgi:predicted nucleic acid-binding protein
MLTEQFRITLIVPDFMLVHRAVAWSQQLRRANTYDCFYLALAEERGCDLWTADSRLFNLADMSWVRLFA